MLNVAIRWPFTRPLWWTFAISIFSVLFLSLLPLPAAELFEAESSDFQSRISHHPTVLTIRLRKALANLVDSPDSIFKMGIKSVPGNQDLYRRILRHILRNSKLTDLKFNRYNDLHIASGRVDSLTLTVSNISVSPLLFDSLTITLLGVRFDLDSLSNDNLFVMTEVEGFSFEVAVSEESLSSLVGSGFSLELREGQLQVVTVVKFLMFQLNARVGGTLFVRDSESICFSANSLNVGNLPFADLFKSRVSARLNPLFSLKKCMGKSVKVFDSTLAGVAIDNGRITISGEGTIALSK